MGFFRRVRDGVYLISAQKNMVSGMSEKVSKGEKKGRARRRRRCTYLHEQTLAKRSARDDRIGTPRRSSEFVHKERAANRHLAAGNYVD